MERQRFGPRLFGSPGLLGKGRKSFFWWGSSGGDGRLGFTERESGGGLRDSFLRAFQLKRRPFSGEFWLGFG